jgi:DNA-binding transcriptional LysR family regulator
MISPPPARALDDISVFVAVARQASFVAASRRLGLPTSSVSRAVARLEEALGRLLLRRSSRRVALTDEGAQLLAQAGPLVDGLQEALAATTETEGEPAGLIRVTAPAFTGATRVAAALASFARRHPRVTIELDASNAVRDLVEDGFDLGVRVGPVGGADLVARRLWKGHFGLFATREFLRRAVGKRGVVTREVIEAGPCVVMRSSLVWRFRDAQDRLVEVTPRACFAVNDPRAAVEVARQGVGLVLAPLDAAAVAPELVGVAADLGAPEPLDLFLVYPTKRLLSRRVRLAIDWLVDPPGGHPRGA